MYFDITNKSGSETHRKRWGTRAKSQDVGNSQTNDNTKEKNENDTNPNDISGPNLGSSGKPEPY